MMKKQYYFMIVALFCMTPIFAVTIYVKPGGTGNGTTWAQAYGSLVTALGNAQTGDAIWVQQGTYKPSAVLDTNASFVFKNGVKVYGGFSGNEMTLGERADISGTTTILSGELSSSVHSKTILKVNNAISALNLLDGFTIQGANWTITNAVYGGGGIQVIGSTMELRNVTIKDNTVALQYTGTGNGMVGGAGLFGYQSNISLYNVDVVNNNFSTTSTVDNAQVLCGGAGIMMYDGTLHYQKGKVQSNTIASENLYAAGGGAYIFAADSVYIQDVTVADNTGEGENSDGAGIRIGACPDVELINTLFHNNSGDGRGDALVLSVSEAVITNVTFGNNGDSNPPYIIYVEESEVTFNNTVFLGQVEANSLNTVTYNNCVSKYGYSFGSVNNSVMAEMKFVDSRGGNYTPSSCSQHLNFSNSSFNILSTDIKGNPRTIGGGMDPGAIELQNLWINNRVYVNAASTNNFRDGASWASAFTTLDEALNCGCDNDGVIINPEVWVAEGIYKPRFTSEEGFSTFKLNSDQKIYGGFASGATSLDDRDLTWEVYPTILSGHIGGDQYLYSVVNSRYHDADTELNGFIIEDGSALDPGGWGRNGAALYVRDGQPTLKNLWVRNNTTAQSGAVYFYDAGAIMENIKLTDNVSGSSGAGIYFYGSQGNAGDYPPTIITNIEASNNTANSSGGGAIWIERNFNVSIDGFNFSNNIGNHLGGAIFVDRATLNLSRGVFSGNGGPQNTPVTEVGGAVYIDGAPGDASVVHMESVQFSTNVANVAGVLFMSHSLVDIVNCTFADNHGTVGANLFAATGGTFRIKNSIIDSPSNGHPHVMVYPNSQATNPLYTLTNSLVTDNFTPIFTIGNDVMLNTDPLFIDSANGDYNLTACGPAVDAGINAFLEMSPMFDADDNPRIKNLIVDLGALEYQYIDLAIEQPADVTVAAGTQAQFAVTVNLTGMNYQWQVSADNGVTWTDIPNATIAILQISPATTAMNGYLYRLQVSDCDHAGISGGAVLTVTAPLGIQTVENPSHLLLYPNPVKYGFTLNMETTTTEGILAVYDAQGRKILQRTLTAKALTEGTAIDASDWAAGMYWVSFKGEQQYTVKLLKE